MIRKADPYGRDKPSSIPSPTKPTGEIVPRYNPPGIPPYLKPIPINTRDTLAVLRGYLNATEPKVVRWLYSTWNAEREAIKYQELRNAVRDKEMPLEWILQWQQDYSRFVVEVLEPEWRKAIQSAGTKMGENIEAYAGRPFGFTPTGRRIEEWIQVRGGELAVALSDLQHQAMRAILRYYTVDNPVSPDELGRILRPVVGLTPKQAEAVRRFRENLIAEGLPLKKVEHQVLNYAGYLHRFRALRIARTELSFAYNYGQFEAIRQAKEAGFFGGEVVKVWLTAHDERTCPHCGPLDGQMIGLEETFPGATGKVPHTYTPPAHPNCFSEDTEVFTEEGWKHFYELTGREKIWTLNLETEELELDEAVAWIEYPYEGEMIHLSNRTIDCLVTPDHNMVVRSDWMHKKHKNSPLILRRADDLKYGDVIPRTAKWRGKHVDTITIGQRVFPARAFMRFLGWYIAEGSISKPARGHWQIKIAQEKEENRKEIIELCRQLFGDVWIGADAIYVPRLDDIKDYFLALGKAHEKHLPSEIKGLSAELLKELWEAFCLGDGYIRQSSWKDHPEWNFGKEYVATTSSRQLMNDLTEIALKISMRPSFRVEQPKTIKHWNGVYTSKHEQWWISFGSRRYSVFEPQYWQRVPYKGRVYCVQMKRNPTLFVRRNGKTLWAGNCRCTVGYQVLERRT